MTCGKKPKQQLLQPSAFVGPSPFSFDLCEALIAANIPFAKIHNSKFSAFLKTTAFRCTRQIYVAQELPQTGL